MVAKEYECEIPQNPGPYDNKVNDNNNNNTKKTPFRQQSKLTY